MTDNGAPVKSPALRWTVAVRSGITGKDVLFGAHRDYEQAERKRRDYERVIAARWPDEEYEVWIEPLWPEPTPDEFISVMEQDG